MEHLRAVLKRLRLRREPTNGGPEFKPLTNDAVCLVCGGLLVGRADVKIALKERELDGGSVRCQCSEDAEQRKTRRWRAANLPHEDTEAVARTFDNFKTRKGTAAALDAARQFVEGMGPRTLTLVGGPGTGKSHLLEAIGRASLDRGRRVKYELASDLFDRLRATYAEDTLLGFEQVMGQYRAAEVLLLDDVGMEKGTDFVVERMTGLVDFRIREGKPLAVATNLREEQMGKRLGPRLASRVYDAHSGAVRLVWLTCGDYRLEGA